MFNVTSPVSPLRTHTLFDFYLPPLFGAPLLCTGLRGDFPWLPIQVKTNPLLGFEATSTYAWVARLDLPTGQPQPGELQRPVAAGHEVPTTGVVGQHVALGHGHEKAPHLTRIWKPLWTMNLTLFSLVVVQLGHCSAWLLFSLVIVQFNLVIFHCTPAWCSYIRIRVFHCRPVWATYDKPRMRSGCESFLGIGCLVFGIGIFKACGTK